MGDKNINYSTRICGHHKTMSQGVYAELTTDMGRVSLSIAIFTLNNTIDEFTTYIIH